MSDETIMDEGTEEEAPENQKTEEQTGNKEAELKSDDGTKEEESTSETADDDAPYWPEDWREKAAQHVSAGEEKAYKRELKRLERLKDPSAVYGMYRELETKFTSGSLTKIPGEDASEEDKRAFYNQIGVPEKADDYVKDFKFEDGEDFVGDDEDAKELLEALHKNGTPKESAHAVLNFLHERENMEAEMQDEEDEQYHWESQRALKEEMGPAYKRTINNISQLFRYGAGGLEAENEESVRNRLLNGRTADGIKIGDDPDMIRWLAAVSHEVDPVATVMDTTAASGRGVEERIKEIEKMIRTDKHAYFKDQDVQNEYVKLLEVRDKVRASAR